VRGAVLNIYNTCVYICMFAFTYYCLLKSVFIGLLLCVEKVVVLWRQWAAVSLVQKRLRPL